MNIALITDLHFGCRGDSLLHLENQLEFYEKVFFPELEKNRVKTCLILGDVWDRRKYININTLHVFREKFFRKLKDLDVAVKVLYGNHDTSFRNTNSVNSLDFIGEAFDNIEIIDTPRVFDFDGLKIGMISWINSSNREESIEFIKTADCRILCGHFEINGFEMVKGHYCSGGFEAKDFSRFEEVFSGHFHITSTSDGISYLGNPNQNDWGDYGLKKGFWILDSETCERVHIQNPFNLYEKLQYDDEVDVIKFDYTPYKGKIVRVYVASFEVTNKKKLSLFIDRLGADAYSVEVMEQSTTGSVEDEDELIDMVGSDTSAMIDQYITSVGVSSSFDASRLKGYFAEVYQEANDKMING